MVVKNEFANVVVKDVEPLCSSHTYATLEAIEHNKLANQMASFLKALACKVTKEKVHEKGPIVAWLAHNAKLHADAYAHIDHVNESAICKKIRRYCAYTDPSHYLNFMAHLDIFDDGNYRAHPTQPNFRDPDITEYYVRIKYGANLLEFSNRDAPTYI